eukprot:1673999-Pleurochrysis_carterae.AAC.3
MQSDDDVGRIAAGVLPAVCAQNSLHAFLRQLVLQSCINVVYAPWLLCPLALVPHRASRPAASPQRSASSSSWASSSIVPPRSPPQRSLRLSAHRTCDNIVANQIKPLLLRCSALESLLSRSLLIQALCASLCVCARAVV